MLPRARDCHRIPLLLIAAWLTLGGCGIELPYGKLACKGDADCPRNWRCLPPGAADGRCYPASAAQAPDAALPEAGSHTPTSPDMVPADPSKDAPPEPTPAEQSDDSVGALPPPPPPLPDHIRFGPECGEEPEASAGILTSAGVGKDAADCGGRSVPCKSLQKALDRAGKSGLAYVYLDNTETYVASETLSLPANVTVMGGFSNVNGRWTRLCADAQSGGSHIASTANPVLVASYDGYSKLDGLWLEGPKAAAGESRYGIVARGDKTRLWLRNVSVAAADGGDGSAGSAPVPTQPLAAMSCLPGDGANAPLEGSPGVSGPSGSFGPDGYLPGNGGDGASGMAGNAGSLATAPMCASCGDCPCGGVVESCGARGEVGCGGPGGAGGAGGLGGGSSIALYAWDAALDITASRLTAGRGGDGGAGGEPGAGGIGLAGNKGAAGATCAVCTSIGEGGCVQIGVATGEGTTGGNGGNGSAGGRGGAGSGGVAYAIYRNSRASLTLAADARLEHGRAGRGPAGAAQGKAAAVSP